MCHASLLFSTNRNDSYLVMYLHKGIYKGDLTSASTITQGMCSKSKDYNFLFVDAASIRTFFKTNKTYLSKPLNFT
jgi:hypothetical protein